MTIVTDKEAKFKRKTNYQKNNDGSLNDCLFCKKKKNNNNNRKPSTIQEICSHKQLQCDLWGDGKFWNLGTAVGVSYFVHEISTDFGQHMGTIINNKELRVCFKAMLWDIRDGKVSYDSTCYMYLFWASEVQNEWSIK